MPKKYKPKIPKVTYVCSSTPESKEADEKAIEEAYAIIFDTVWMAEEW